MKRIISIFAYIGILLLFSCQNKIISDSKVAEELLNKFHGKSGSLYYVQDKLAKSKDKAHFIRFIINGSEIAFTEDSKTSYAPSIAIDLFNKLSKKTISNNYAIEIIFDKNDQDYKKYFYSIEDLEIINYNIEVIRDLIDDSFNTNHKSVISLIDTSIFHYQEIDSILNRIKTTYEGVDNSKTLFSFYKHDRYDGDSKTLDKYFEIFVLLQDYSMNNRQISFACLPIKRKPSIVGIFF